MAKKIALDLEIKSTSVGEATKKTTSLRTEIRNLREQMASGELKGEAFTEAAKRAAAMQDQMDKVNKTVKTLANDNRRLDAFVSTAQGIAGGFAAAQGAAALFGSENEDLQKTMVKLQASMTLLNGLQQVSNLLRKESALNTVLLGKANVFATTTTGGLTKGMKLLRIAIISTGIGALVVGIGLLIANFDKVKKAVLDFIPGLSKVGEIFTRIKNAVTDFIGVTSDATRAIEAQQKAFEAKQKIEEYEIELMEAMGKSQEEIFWRKYNLIKEELKILEQAQKDKGKLEGKELERFQRLTIELEALKTQRGNRIGQEMEKEKEDAKKHGDNMAKIAKDNAAKRAAAQAVDTERRLMLIQDEEQRELALLQNKHAKELAAAKEKGHNLILLERLQIDEEMALRESFRERQQQALELEIKERDKVRAEEKKKEDERRDATIQAGIKANAERLANEKATDEAILAAKEAFTNQSISILASLSNLARDNSKTQKALALGAIAVDTGAAISAAVRNSQANPANAVTGGVAGAVQFATSLAQILSGAAQAKRVLQGGQVRGAGASAGSARTSTELQPPTQINRDIQVQDRGGNGQRVFVLENDITTTQDRVGRIRANSVID
jgi:hypothetical protein